MAVGNSLPADPNSEVEQAQTGAPQLPQPQDTPFLHVARPLKSPRLLPLKRPAEAESRLQDGVCQLAGLTVEYSPVKKSKLDINRFTDALNANSPETPEKAARAAGVVGVERPQDQASRCARHLDLEDALSKSRELFIQAFTAYALEKDLNGEVKSHAVAEQWATDHYDELRMAILRLLPFSGPLTAAKNGAYDVIEFQRHAATAKDRRRMIEKGNDWKEELQHFGKELRLFRAESDRSRAWEGLCALCAAVSARAEKVWLESFDLEDDLEDIPKNYPGCKDKRSARRREVIRDMMPQLVCSDGAGAFLGYCLDPRSTHRVAFARGLAGPVPATSITFRRMTLWDALKTMDDEGPLRGEASKREWCCASGRQFALQDLEFGHDPESRQARKPARELQPDSQFRDLLRGKKEVILLDTLAALAPREHSKTHGLSKIVQAELAALCKEAKDNGEAVVLCLGTSSPHRLAERVYLRPPLVDYGMRCGWVRWRESASEPWAREYKWESRTAIGIQMP